MLVWIHSRLGPKLYGIPAPNVRNVRRLCLPVRRDPCRNRGDTGVTCSRRGRHPTSPLVICPAQGQPEEGGHTAAITPQDAQPKWVDVEMMTKRGMSWLAATADDPVDCRLVWTADPRHPYALPAGRYFDVVVIEERVGMETYEQLDRCAMPLGPVMVDWASRQTGFFLPSRSRERFERMVKHETTETPEYRYLSKGSTVVVPGPMPLSGDRYAWLRAPMHRPEATIARTAALAAMFVATAALVSRADRYRQEYQDIHADVEAPADAQRA